MHASTEVEAAAPIVRNLPEPLLRWLVQKKAPSPNDLPAVLKSVAWQLAEELRAEAAAIYIITPAGNRMQLQALVFSDGAHGRQPDRMRIFSEKTEQLERMVLPITEQTPSGRTVLTSQPLQIRDAREVENFYHPVSWAPDFIVRTLIAVPLQTDRTVGCMEVLNKSGHSQFSAEDLARVNALAWFVARAAQRCESPPINLNERERGICLAGLAGCEFVDLSANYQLDPALVSAVGREHLQRYCVLPLARVADRGIRAAVANPLEYQCISDFEVVSGLKVAERVVACESSIREALEKLFSAPDAMRREAESVLKDLVQAEPIGPELAADEETENSGPIIKLANRIIEDAHAQGASDIHVEPYEDRLSVRYRVDGVCRNKFTLPRDVHRALISRLKIMSDLDIAERRLPQDGRIVFRRFSNTLDIHLRVSTAPTAHGEAMVLRLLDRTKSMLPLNQLGFSEYNLQRYRRVIQAPYGMILHVGPTGSGKSMTLFAALNEINSPEWKILTAEDPIEYTLDAISQVQVKADIGLTFASVLRCFLRQDPDIILVGEIRDGETAEIAIEAALTGHLLFSTLHTNDAP
ncbi:MAG TPA: ATPase, T2SS/T4P/T4SS family, partial [Planctomycetota bacterium]|nr:ATPase, T2SS/T4P/T4SS family [Planctomycetota bacterium]